jgi:hypothetical protein
MDRNQLEMKCQRYENALKEIATLEDIDDAQEAIIKLMFQINDALLAVRSIAKTALEEAQEETEFLEFNSEFEPFPDEIGNCPRCGKPLAVRNGKRGKFIGCTGYPDCRFTKDIFVKEKEEDLTPPPGYDPRDDLLGSIESAVEFDGYPYGH